MNALVTIGWFICLLLSIGAIFEVIGFRALAQMFPEYWRWWQFPAQVLVLVIFAITVLFHPF